MIKYIKICISFPVEVLAILDKSASGNYMNRSEYIKYLITKEVKMVDVFENKRIA
jgi:metal-responsive CopG/Arc/MetJ family transcriptional regulator